MIYFSNSLGLGIFSYLVQVHLFYCTICRVCLGIWYFFLQIEGQLREGERGGGQGERVKIHTFSPSYTPELPANWNGCNPDACRIRNCQSQSLRPIWNYQSQTSLCVTYWTKMVICWSCNLGTVVTVRTSDKITGHQITPHHYHTVYKQLMME